MIERLGSGKYRNSYAVTEFNSSMSLETNLRWVCVALTAVLLQFYFTQTEWSIGSDFLEVQQRVVKKLFTERKNEKLVQQAQDKKQSLGVDVQPDEVRMRSDEDPGQPEEECVNTAYGPHSTLTTRQVEIEVASSFRCAWQACHKLHSCPSFICRGSYSDPAKFGREQYQWSYHVTFKNHGKDTVRRGNITSVRTSQTVC